MINDYDPNDIYQFRTHKINMDEGIGTHLDAPAHCFEKGRCINDINLEELVAPCVMLDISKKAHENYSLSEDDIQLFEKSNGEIKPGSFVIVYTGWDKHWEDPIKYRNDLVYPSISAAAAAFLVIKRNIVGIGIDTLSPDRASDGFPVHQIVLGADKYIVENIANASKLPPIGSYSLALPLKIREGTEAPIRLVGLIFD